MTRSPASTLRTASASWAAGASLTRNAWRAGLHRRAQIAGAAERGEDDDLEARAGASRSAAAASMPVMPGISMSSSATSGPCARRRCQHLVAAGHLGDHLDVGFEPEQRREGLPHHRLVLGEQDLDLSAHAPDPTEPTGTRATSRNPRSRPGPASRVPPTPSSAFAQARQAVARNEAAARRGAGPVVLHGQLQDGAAEGLAAGDADRAAAGAAVPYDVGDGLAQRPGERGLAVSAGRSSGASDGDVGLDAGGGERGARSGQFARRGGRGGSR